MIEVHRGADRLHPASGEEGTTVGEVCRKAGISEATYYNWRKKYAGVVLGNGSWSPSRPQSVAWT
jgi:transposase-like protein